MYSKFESLTNEKQLRILNAAFDEFSQKKFREASTDTIATKAEISKGALFQYFGTKKKLYEYVYSYGYQMLKDELYGKIDFSIADIFDRLRQILHAKIDVFFQHPTLFDFLVFAYSFEDDASIKQLTIDKNSQEYEQFSLQVFEGLDYSRFKAGIDVNKSLRVILWTVDGYSKMQVELMESCSEKGNKQELYKQWSDEFDIYMSMLKKAFYRTDSS